MTKEEINMALIAPGYLFLALCIGYAIAVLNRSMSGRSGSEEVRTYLRSPSLRFARGDGREQAPQVEEGNALGV
jgi:hypothetical protein